MTFTGIAGKREEDDSKESESVGDEHEKEAKYVCHDGMGQTYKKEITHIHTYIQGGYMYML